ncbi:hypothetical protein [Maribacter polysaccharolyticus]|uniref:hypothetical protein n=1 Tax=Maribacter polysaccharolyticus TaxID=3020831 RepID=UPI00237F0359|nr:hypothetical protein [Maribacter polysaccharolyticus]MDE3743210.1 hypothetical protein [Maribacter polysaccharolyticus]
MEKPNILKYYSNLNQLMQYPRLYKEQGQDQGSYRFCAFSQKLLGMQPLGVGRLKNGMYRKRTTWHWRKWSCTEVG